MTHHHGLQARQNSGLRLKRIPSSPSSGLSSVQKRDMQARDPQPLPVPGLINLDIPLVTELPIVSPLVNPLLSALDPLISFQKANVQPPPPPPPATTTPAPPPSNTPPANNPPPTSSTGSSPGGGNSGGGGGGGGNSGGGTSPGNGNNGGGNASPPSGGSSGTPPSGNNGGNSGSGSTTPGGGGGDTGSGLTPGGNGTSNNNNGSNDLTSGTVNAGTNPGDNSNANGGNPDTGSGNANNNGTPSSGNGNAPSSPGSATTINGGNFGSLSSTTYLGNPTLPSGSTMPSDTGNTSASTANGTNALAIGLGVGVTVTVIALIALLFLCCRRRRKDEEPAGVLETSEKSASRSILQIGRSPSQAQDERFSQQSFASPITREWQADGDPFADHSSHGHSVANLHQNDPFKDQNPFSDSLVAVPLDPSIDNPTQAFPSYGVSVENDIPPSAPPAGYAAMSRQAANGEAVPQPSANRESVASNESTRTITPTNLASFAAGLPAAAATALTVTAPSEKHNSNNTVSTIGEPGVFPIPLGDNGGVYIIRRPFNPSLQDELAVSSGDIVTLVRSFDDGWAFVTKNLSPNLAGTSTRSKGLIPLECFYAQNQRDSVTSVSSTLSRSSSLGNMRNSIVFD